MHQTSHVANLNLISQEGKARKNCIIHQDVRSPPVLAYFRQERNYRPVKEQCSSEGTMISEGILRSYL